MKEIVDKILDKNPKSRPSPFDLLYFDIISREAFKIQKKVAEAD